MSILSSKPRCVLITGAAKRLGREIALRLAQNGWGIALHYRHSAAEAAQTLADCQQAAAAAGHSHGCFAALPADLADEEINVDLITQDTQTLLERYEMVLLEAAGGLAVPITHELSILDYIAQQAYPLVLVSGGKLGSINHTVLSLKACEQANIPVLGLIYNRYPLQDALIARYTEAYLRDYIQVHHPQAEFCVVEQQ